MTDTEDVGVSGSRASSAMSTASQQTIDSEVKRDTSSELPTPSPSRLSNCSDMSHVSSRTFYSTTGFPIPADTRVPGYPSLGYPDSGYPTDNLYPSVAFPATGKYPKSNLPGSPYPSNSLPKSPYPESPPPVSPYPRQDYPDSQYKPVSDYSGSEATSLVFSEDLGVSRASSEIMYPMSTFPESGKYPVPDGEEKQEGAYLP